MVNRCSPFPVLVCFRIIFLKKVDFLFDFLFGFVFFRVVFLGSFPVFKSNERSACSYIVLADFVCFFFRKNSLSLFTLSFVLSRFDCDLFLSSMYFYR